MGCILYHTRIGSSSRLAAHAKMVRSRSRSRSARVCVPLDICIAVALFEFYHLSSARVGNALGSKAVFLDLRVLPAIEEAYTRG